MIRILIIVLISFTLAQTAFAQEPTAPSEKPKVGPRKQLATIVFAGLGGAVLGLSTLSFYGRPQEYLNNIAIGAAVGIFAGVIYVTYNQAKKPVYYNSNAELSPKSHIIDLDALNVQNQRKFYEQKISPTVSIFQVQIN